jgi:CxxC-x17-CxxC domain-containing protein
MHKTICADCKNECEVPFVPSGNRPVYCQECFSRRKNNNSFRPNIASKPKQTFTAHLDSFKRLQVADKKNSPAKKKFLEKKKTVFKKKRRAR